MKIIKLGFYILAVIGAFFLLLMVISLFISEEQKVIEEPKALDESQIIENAKQSIVAVNYDIVEDDGIFGKQSFSFLGSGVIVKISDSKVYILTNKHVVDWDFLGWKEIDPDEWGEPEILSEKISIKTYEGKVYPGEVINLAPKDIDLDLVSFDSSSKEKLSATKINFAYEPKAGNEVIAIGNPVGLEFSVSKGIVSNLLERSSVSGMNYYIIQTDAAINPGNSGGGMFTLNDGRLVGINTAKIVETDIEGIGFAVHVGTFEKLLEQNKINIL